MSFLWSLTSRVHVTCIFTVNISVWSLFCFVFSCHTSPRFTKCVSMDPWSHGFPSNGRNVESSMVPRKLPAWPYRNHGFPSLENLRTSRGFPFPPFSGAKIVRFFQAQNLSKFDMIPENGILEEKDCALWMPSWTSSQVTWIFSMVV